MLEMKEEDIIPYLTEEWAKNPLDSTEDEISTIEAIQRQLARRKEDNKNYTIMIKINKEGNMHITGIKIIDERPSVGVLTLDGEEA